MDEIAPEYDVVVLGTGMSFIPHPISPPLSASRPIPASESFDSTLAVTVWILSHDAQY